MASALSHIHKIFLGLAFWVACMAFHGQTMAVEDSDEEPLLLDIRLMGSDLIDEMVYDWLSSSFSLAGRPMAITQVSAPVGLDGRFSDFVENRLYEIVSAHPPKKIKLVQCSVCREIVTKSTAQGTIMSRGIDQPEILQNVLTRIPDLVALDLTFEVEGKELVLRSVAFEPGGDQRVLWARRYSWSRASRNLLRDSEPLLSHEEAKKVQNSILEGRDQLQLVTRISVRNFSSKTGVQPLPFVEQSLEGVLLPNRDYRAAITLGFISIQESMEGWSVGGHVSALMMRSTPSLIYPDLYWFVGLHYLRLRGPDALPYGEGQVNIELSANPDKEPRASLTAWRMGLETHVKYRMGAFIFMEYVPRLDEQSNIFEKVDRLIIPYHALGGGVLFRW